MTGSPRWLFSLAIALVASSAGCSDLGSCDDPARGRTTVRLGRDVLYAGQAIITQSCATGCHSSSAEGAERQGVPVGLDFDLRPLAPGKVKTSNNLVTSVTVDSKALDGLRSRQAKIHEDRESIWDQVRSDMMPPGKLGEAFRRLTLSVFRFQPDGTCPELAKLSELDQGKETLRDWLACGSPIVETSSEELPFAVPASGASEADTAAGAHAFSGRVGFQYPSCRTGEGETDGGSGPSFDQVYTEVLAACVSCHAPGGVGEPLDLSTPAKAYRELLGADGAGGVQSCASNRDPYVTPNDPERSYLLVKVGAVAGGKCGTLMPFDPGLQAMDAKSAKLVVDWVAAGALGPN